MILCPKCGYEASGRSWVRLEGKEFLLMSCDCGYQWQQPCLDAPKTSPADAPNGHVAKCSDCNARTWSMKDIGRRCDICKKGKFKAVT